MENIQPKEKLLSKDYILIMCAALGTAFCNFFFFTTLPLYAEKVSGSNVYGGLMLTVYSIAALAARPIAGILSDRTGRVKLLIIGAFVCAVACALYGITTAILLLLAIRVLNGLGFGVHSTSSGAAVADVIPKSRISEGIGYFSLYSTLATALGPFIALTIIGDGELKNFQHLFFLASSLCLFSMVSACFISYERKAKKTDKPAVAADAAVPPEAPAEAPAGPLPKTFVGFEYAVFLPTAVLILLNFASSSINTFLTLFAQDRGLGNVGLFFTVNAVGLFISRMLFGRIADRHGPDVVVIPGVIALALCYCAIPFLHSPLWLFVLAFPMGIANGAIIPTINALMFQRCSPQRRGTVSAAYFAALDIGFAIGGSVFGFVADSLGFGYLYWTAAVLTAAACILYIRTVAEKRQLKLKKAESIV